MNTVHELNAQLDKLSQHIDAVEQSENWQTIIQPHGDEIVTELRVLRDSAKVLNASEVLGKIRSEVARVVELQKQGVSRPASSASAADPSLLNIQDLPQMSGESGASSANSTYHLPPPNRMEDPPSHMGRKLKALQQQVRALNDEKANCADVALHTDLAPIHAENQRLQQELSLLAARVAELENNNTAIAVHNVAVHGKISELSNQTQDLNRDTGELSIRLRSLEDHLRRPAQRPTVPQPMPTTTRAPDATVATRAGATTRATTASTCAQTQAANTTTAPPRNPERTQASTTITSTSSAYGSIPGIQPIPSQVEQPPAVAPTETVGEGSETSTPYLDRLERKIKKNARDLLALLTPKIDDSLTKGDILNLHQATLPKVTRDQEKLDKLLDAYHKEAGGFADEHIVLIAEDNCDRANAWCEALVLKYSELDCGNKSLSSTFFKNLNPFTELTDVSIYEHINKFEQIVADQGSKKDRARLLYSTYIDENVQRKCIEFKEDYEGLKEFLLQKYGDPRTMCTNIAKSIPTEPPSDYSLTVNLVDHYRILDAATKKVDELFKLPTVNQQELTAYAFSGEFITRLFNVMPYKARNELLIKLTQQGLNTTALQGPQVYRAMKEIITMNCNVIESHHRLNPLPQAKVRTQQPKSKHVEVQSGTGDTTVHLTEAGDSTAKGKKSRRKSKKQTDGTTVQANTASVQAATAPKTQARKTIPINTKYKYPCPISKHDHEVGTCTDFLQARPETRRMLSTGRMCWNCLGQFAVCNKKCQVTVPSELICQKCTDYGKTKGFGALNHLMCHKDDHKTDLDPTQFTKALEAYLPGFVPSQCDAKKLIGTFVTYLTAHSECSECAPQLCSCHANTKTRKPDPSQKIQCINSESGEIEKVDASKIVKESREDCFYVMQILNVLGKDVLTFFDSGANHNLIRGSIGEEVGMKVVTDAPVSVGMVGGGKVWTEYGSYRFCLGPTENGDYHVVTAQGISNVTAQFNRYDLGEINQEVKQENKLPPNTVYPDYVGGMDAGLLIGINTCGLEPLLQFRLPSGLGVYTSPIKDRFGSRICYGGPHSVFTEVNRRAGVTANHVQAYFTEMINQYRYSPYVTLSHSLEPELEESLPGFMVHKRSSQHPAINFAGSCNLNKTPLDEIDYQEMGYVTKTIPDQHEADVTECECIHVCMNSAGALSGNSPKIGKSSKDQNPKIHINKAKISVAKLKGYIDEQDVDPGYSPRCENCKLCTKCGLSSKSRMISLQEQVEQQAIDESVKVDIENAKVYVDLPFIKSPVPHLRKRHHDRDSNYQQALRMMKSCCRKPSEVKESLIRVHKDLVDKGFMKKLTDLTPKQQDTIRTAAFKHYMPWNVAHKPDSASTPHRITVDASITGLNEILAKGENQLSQIPDILIRNRCRQHIWSSDVSKLYNQLVLTDDALPYGLFLFSENLDLNEDPTVYVMMVAWYGVSSTGNQAAVALNRLTHLLQDKFPLVKQIIETDLYVDDIMTGSNSKTKTEQQITQTTTCLASGGFSLKYIVKSGAPPTEETGSTDSAIRVLGYKWETESDNLMCGFKEINFQKKKRGAKPNNPFEVTSHEDLDKLLKDVTITRRVITSKMAELYDPCGFWEPYKLQLKLDNSMLKGMDWDTPVPEELEQKWKTRFHEFLQLPNLLTPRCVIPPDAVNPNQIRLICVADAAKEAGGTAIYAGFEKSDGTYSSTLLMSKSKIMNQSVPRNELEAIRLMTDTAQATMRSLGDKVTEVLYFTDSQVALCWCSNITKKLRLYVLFRVAEIRRNILGDIHPHDQLNLPLYHIEGTVNPADYLTKPHNITPNDLHPNSLWQKGYEWMTLPTHLIPKIEYTDLAISKDVQRDIDDECFPEPIITGAHHTYSDYYNQTQHCVGCPQGPVATTFDMCYGNADIHHCDQCTCSNEPSSFLSKGEGAPNEKVHLANVIRLGYKKTLRVYSLCFKFIQNMKHKLHLTKEQKTDDCKLCQTNEYTDPQEINAHYAHCAEELLYSEESRKVLSLMDSRKKKEFIVKDDRIYYESRLTSETTSKDMSIDVFFDSSQFKPLLPVIRADSELFFALAIHVHMNVRPHSGIETSLREICQIAWPINSPRRYLQRIRKDCMKCRIIAKKTLELRMLNHPAARNTVAPPFYISQVDTVFGFSAQFFKGARRTIKVYALIICCLFTGATNILTLESLSTRDVLQALERHAARYGMPAILYIDNGTQLMALSNASFNLKDLKDQARDSHAMDIRVSNAKSHEERGRIESRVKIMRGMLDKLALNSAHSFTYLQWETIFAKISSEMNDLPIAKPSNSSHNDELWNVITPNRLLLGRNNNRNLKHWISLSKGSDSETLLRKNQEIMRSWYAIFLDRIHYLIPRPRKWQQTDTVAIGDIVLFMFNETPGSKSDNWKLGIVKDIPKKNSLTLEYISGKSSKKTLNRCPRDVSVIASAKDLPMNSEGYFKNLIKETIKE